MNMLLTRQVTADMIDLMSVLALAARSVAVRLVDQDLDTTAGAFTLFSALLLLVQHKHTTDYALELL